MAKRTEAVEAWRHFLAAAVVEYGQRRVRPYTLKIPARALRNGDPAGTLATLRLPRGDLLLTYTPPPPQPRLPAKAKG